MTTTPKVIKVLLIANDSSVSNLPWCVPPTMSYSDATVEVTHNPDLYVDGSDLDSFLDQYDLVIAHEKELPRWLEMFLDHHGKLVKVTREDKSVLQMQLYLAATNSPIEVHFPFWVTPWDYKAAHILPDCNKLIAKPVDGARGECQILAPTDLMDAILTMSSDIPVNQLNERFPEATFYFGEEHYAQGVLRDDAYFDVSNLMILPYIEDVVSEWRVVVSGSCLHMYRRQIEHTDNGTRIVVAGRHTYTVDGLKVENEEEALALNVIEHTGDTCTSVWRELREVIKGAGITLGSVDVYVRADGTVGIFEWCPQFGTLYSDREQRRQLGIDFVTYWLDEKKIYIPEATYRDPKWTRLSH